MSGGRANVKIRIPNEVTKKDLYNAFKSGSAIRRYDMSPVTFFDFWYHEYIKEKKNKKRTKK
jgi:hypothetical protein